MIADAARILALRWLAGLLLVSLAGNVLLGWAWLGARDKLTRANEQLAQATGAYTACSEATVNLRTLADKRAKEAEAARTAAAKTARTHAQRADRTLATAPALPGDMCASMQQLGDTWLKGRVYP